MREELSRKIPIPNIFKYIRNWESKSISMLILLVKFKFLTYLNILGLTSRS